MVSRREFVGHSAAGGALLLVPALGGCAGEAASTNVELHPGAGVPHFRSDGSTYEVLPREHAVKTPHSMLGGEPSTEAGAFNYPVGMVLSASSMFVLELGNARIQRFDDERPMATFGEYGGDEGQFRRPRDIVQGPDGHLYVADTLNHRVQVLTTEGRFVRAFGTVDTLNGARSLTIDERGSVHVASESSIEVFDNAGAHVGSYGGELQSPRCVRVDIDGNIRVVDSTLGVVSRFDPEGRQLDSVAPTEGTPAWLSAHPSGDLHLTLHS